MRVEVDFDVCQSTGTCQQICPEVFEVRDDGYLYVLQEEPAEKLWAKVREARSQLSDGGHLARGEARPCRISRS